MSSSMVIRLEGHIVDSLVLAKVLDLIVDSGSTYEILEMRVGTTRSDPSRVRLEVTAASDEVLDALFSSLHVHGANREDAADATLAPAPEDGVLPEGFYATTNLPTRVKVEGRWVEVARPEMDCAVVVEMGPGGHASARTVPMHRVLRGDLVVVGWEGVRVERPNRRSPATGVDASGSAGTGASAPGSAGGDSEGFGFMTSEVSSEKPKALSVARVAQSVQAGAKAGKVLVVAGPAVVHTGAAPALAAMVRAGFVQVLFAGNGFATHDIESAVLGTSLGVPLSRGGQVEHGHANHLRVINEMRRFGSIERAVEAGWLTSGVLYECMRAGVPYVLAGSIRDDGPLPGVITDVLQAADVMREHLEGVEVALMLASTLHAIATGNLLPSGVETFCVDINQAVVTKLADRGSHQALGIVTDVGLFVSELAAYLGATVVP
jgi:lysine-ketoglutarate reductase/saccharopine dehydrogenase-like protein (TIGR00300 family)